MRFIGDLLLFINKGHGYYEGRPWLGNPNRKARVEVVMKQAVVSTKQFTREGESTWNESFLFNVDCSGRELVYFNIYLTLDTGVETHIGVFYIELASLLSHTGVQWYQFRSVRSSYAEHAIRGELNVEARWFVDPVGVPQALKDKVSLIASTNTPLNLPTSSPLSRPLSLTKSKPSVDRSSSNASQSSASSPRPQSSIPYSKSTPAVDKLISDDASPSPSHPAHTRSPTGDQSMEQATAVFRSLGITTIDPNLFRLFPSGSKTPTPTSPYSQDRPLLEASVEDYCLPKIPPILSGSLYGRIHPDTKGFDDANFLEHYCALAQLKEVFIWECRTHVLGLQFVWMIAGLRIAGPKHGTTNLSPTIFLLDDGEYLQSIGIKLADSGIKTLTLATSKQQRPFGAPIEMTAEMSHDAVAAAPSGSHIVCVQGGCNAKHGLNNIGVYWVENPRRAVEQSVSSRPSIMKKQVTTKRLGL